ncbi:unnamed protein product [Rotaria socialis]|uniref:Mitochondrial ribosomal protein S36 n=1 Tax=Rotaria socialis TaxID=392032 RepID=A0A817UC44_9BILA|nr:unnamed protein product [Rotaria socialis]CAF3214394.1 unnamed protein product [Rotaria socialis]CAF3328798.1 unnamed protein product [Rotaria socialis]CAF3365628.1 unnamed protein product [Rotaria socialis]CAF4254853.1 unnamed protein product [Rotaria socialis]
MSTMIAHVQKALRHHAPMIRFRYGLNQAGTNSSNQKSATHKHEVHINKNTAAPVPATNQLKAAHKSTSFAFLETPTKYRRRALTQDEIDLIAIGGLK